MSSCNCPNPPGGGHRCEPNQLAICRVENGMCLGECHNPPPGLSRDEIRSWGYGVISGSRRSPYVPLTPREDSIVDQGVYIDPQTGEEIRFSLPQYW